MDTSIRRIRAGEGDQLRQLRLRALADAPGAFCQTHAGAAAEPPAAWAARALARSTSPAEATFVATAADGRWVGMAGGFRNDETPPRVELVAVWVDPAARGAGVAERLVEAVAAWARASHAALLDAWVVEDNRTALRLYERMGFARTGRTILYPRDPAKAQVLLTLALRGAGLGPPAQIARGGGS